MAAELQPGDPETIGPYRLAGRLGQGGMGQVFLGVSPGGRPVAVKVIRAELAADPQFRVRFGREVAAARKVSGVFTAMVVDADTDGPVAWLATAYVPGPSLAEAVDRHGPLPEASLLALAAGLTESLEAIHDAGVVHRDLKPSNVLLAEDGPRVIDFGISRAAESTALTQTGLVIGSPGFMSPEQAMGGEVGPPSDIFSLGAVLAFAATGRGPFGSGTTVTLLYRVVHEAPDLDRVPATVRPLIERCLAKDPARRPTADGLLAELGALRLAGNWLPDSITRAFAAAAGAGPAAPAAGADPAAPVTRADPALAAPGLAPGPGLAATQTALAGSAAPAPAGETRPPAGPAAGRPAAAGGLPPAAADAGHQLPPGGRKRPRRLLLRPLVLASLIVALASGATAFALTSNTGHAPAPARSRPAAQTSAAAASTSAAGVSPRASATASASSPAGASQPASTASSPPASSSPSSSAAPSARPSASASAGTSPSSASSPASPASSSPSAPSGSP